MKVCFVNSNPFWGGAEKWHIRAATYMARQGHEVVFFARAGEVVKSLRDKNVDVRLHPFRNDFDIPTLIPLFSAFRKIRPDAVIFNSERDLRLGGIASTLAGIKTRVHRKGISGLKKKARYKWIYRNLKSHTLCVADAVRKEIEEQHWVEPSSLKTIHNGIDPEEFSPDGPRDLRIELGLKDDEILVGSLARLSSIKGLDNLIKAVPLITEQAENVRFALVGTGRLEDELKALAKELDLGDQLVFTGFKSKTPDVLRSFDVFVLPSVHSEGFPNSVVEAMACAKPVVATTIAGIPEAVAENETGLLVPPRDPQALADAILKLISDSSLRKSMGAAGRERAVDHFDYLDKFKEFEDWLIKITG